MRLTTLVMMLLLGSTSLAQNQDNLLERARAESESSVTPLNEKGRRQQIKKSEMTAAPASMILRMEDSHETPRTRSYDWQMKLSFENLSLQGNVPQGPLGTYDIKDAGAVPLFTLQSGTLWQINDTWSWGAHLNAGFGRREVTWVTPTGQSLNPRLNVVTYGGGLSLKKNWNARFFNDLSFEYGRFMLRQSSTETTLAQWNDDSTAMTYRLGAGYTLTPGWDLSAGLQKRDLPGSRFQVSSTQLVFATGVRW